MWTIQVAFFKMWACNGSNTHHFTSMFKNPLDVLPFLYFILIALVVALVCDYDWIEISSSGMKQSLSTLAAL